MMTTFFFGGWFQILFFLLFILTLGVFILVIARGLAQWNQNNHAPRLTVRASVVAKRISVSHHHHNPGANSMHMTTSTTYYVTFQVESGDRMELHVSGHEYGMLSEGDCGQLHVQGTRYLGFDRV